MVIQNKNKLPKFLYCEDLPGNTSFVLHCRSPRLLIEFDDNDDDGSYESVNVEFFEPAEPDAAKLTKLMYQAGRFLVDYFNRLDRDDDIREIVLERMHVTGINPHRLSEMSGVSKSTVYNFLNGTEIGSIKLRRIFAALGMNIR